MTEQPPAMHDVPITDPTNPFVQAAPCSMSVGPHPQVPGAVILTLRSVNGTFTVMVDRDTAIQWAGHLRQTAQKTSALLVAGPGSIPGPMNGTPR